MVRVNVVWGGVGAVFWETSGNIEDGTKEKVIFVTFSYTYTTRKRRCSDTYTSVKIMDVSPLV